MSEMNAGGAGGSDAGMSGMAGRGGSGAGSGGSGSAGGRSSGAGGGGRGGGQGESTGHTGTPDLDYNLVSILYHALQGAETYDQYIQDAEQGGDRDLAGFFRDVQQENKRRADRAKQILGRRIGGQQGGGGR